MLLWCSRWWSWSRKPFLALWLASIRIWMFPMTLLVAITALIQRNLRLRFACNLNKIRCWSRQDRCRRHRTMWNRRSSKHWAGREIWWTLSLVSSEISSWTATSTEGKWEWCKIPRRGSNWSLKDIRNWTSRCFSRYCIYLLINSL